MAYPNLAELLSLDNPVFRTYVLCNSVLALKMMAMVPLTGRQRALKKVVISPEDTKLIKGATFGVQDPDVERVRSAHLNDLENIPIFMSAAFSYLLTNPDPSTASTLMKLFTAARVVHTIVYAVVVVPQPARGIAFFIGYGITGYMAVTAVIKLLK